MGTFQNTTIIVYCYFINIYYFGIYGIIKSDLFSYQIETVDWNCSAKEKEGGNSVTKKKLTKFKVNKLVKNNSTKQRVLYLQTV